MHIISYNSLLSNIVNNFYSYVFLLPYLYIFLLLCVYITFIAMFMHFIFIAMFMYSYCCVCSVLYILFACANWHSSAILTEGFPCFFLSCKANARV